MIRKLSIILMLALSFTALANEPERRLLLSIPVFLRANNPQLEKDARTIFSDSYKEIFNITDVKPDVFSSYLTSPNTDQIYCTETHNDSAFYISCEFLREKPEKHELKRQTLGCLSSRSDYSVMETSLLHALSGLFADIKKISRYEDGESIYREICFACHGTGAAGAPLLGDKEAWAPRIEKGMDTLTKSAINGLGAMPPKGTCGSCSIEKLQRAIQYMINKSR